MKILSEHWEKLLLGVIVIIALLVILMSISGEAEQLEFNKANKAGAIAEDTTIDYSKVVNRAKATAKAPEEREIFSHGWLQYCTNCKKLHKAFSEKCPECGATVNYKKDSDGDGIDNAWEKKHKLDWTNPADGNLDPDGDKITNIEEFKRDSDPQNPSDPNIVLDEYTLIDVFRPKRHVEFVNVAGESLSFRIGRMSQFKKIGEVINYKKKDLYKIENFAKKTTNIFVKALNSTKKVDISEATLTDLETGEVFTLVKGKPGFASHVEAKIANKQDGKEAIYKKNDKLPLKKFDTEAVIIGLDDKSKECIFAVGNIKYITKPE